MSEKMLVETVYERHGHRFEPVVQTPEEKAAKKEVLFRKMPVIVPIGVMVGINDPANGLGAIRTGWSRCKLPPFNKPEVISDRMFRMLTATGKRQYHAAHAAYDKAVADSDKFNLERGVSEAMKHIFMPADLPKGRGFGKKYAAFQDRCNRYFKDVKAILSNGIVTPNPRYEVPVKKMSPSAEAVLSSIFGKDLLNQMIKIAGPPPQEMLDLVERIGKQDMSGNGCNCPICTARRNQQGIKPAAMPNIGMPPEIQQVVRMIEQILGPIKIVGLSSFKL
jgi:hypothetical protein